MVRKPGEPSPWLLCLPALGLIAAVAGFPLARTFYFAFTDAKLSALDQAKWIGFENFSYLLRDPDWWRAVRNTLTFSLYSVSLETLLGLCGALLLNARFRGRGVLRAAVLVPWAIPTVVSARMWAWMFNDLYGVINEILLKLGWIREGLAWLAEDRLTLVTLVAVDVWKTTPFVTLLLLAGLQGIPTNVLEAAKVDGAGPVRRFFTITLPLLKPALLLAVLFRLLDSLRIFDLPFVLTSNTKSSAVMSVFARQQLIDFQDIGYGSAASFAIFSVIGIILILYLALGRSVSEES